MRIIKGKVVGGQVIVEGDPLDEGSTVTVLVSDESNFTLHSDDEAALLQAITEADRGGLIDGYDVVMNVS